MGRSSCRLSARLGSVMAEIVSPVIGEMRPLCSTHAASSSFSYVKPSAATTGWRKRSRLSKST